MNETPNAIEVLKQELEAITKEIAAVLKDKSRRLQKAIKHLEG